MNWKTEAHSAAAGGYLKLPNNGDSVTVAMIGTPWAYKGKYSQTLRRTVLFNPNNKEHLEDKDFKNKIRALFYDKNTGATLIWDALAKHYDPIAKMDDEKFDFGKKWIRIVRNGQGTSTKYDIMPDSDMTKEEIAAVKATPERNIELRDENQAGWD